MPASARIKVLRLARALQGSGSKLFRTPTSGDEARGNAYRIAAAASVTSRPLDCPHQMRRHALNGLTTAVHLWAQRPNVQLNRKMLDPSWLAIPPASPVSLAPANAFTLKPGGLMTVLAAQLTV